jgi:hypothetical protein
MALFVGLMAAIALSSTVARPATLPQRALPQATSSGNVMPDLPPSAATVESLAPQGWAIEQRHQADFNRDGRADVLLLLRNSAADAGTPPRVLLIALATAAPRGYALSEANARLLPRDVSGAIEDPMADGEITVRPGGFDLRLGMTPGTGSYLTATMRYRFRREGGCFRLIGYERMETHRATLDTKDLSVNFLNGAVIHKTGNAQSDNVGTRRERLRNNPRRCLVDLDNGWTFDPLLPAR